MDPSNYIAASMPSQRKSRWWRGSYNGGEGDVMNCAICNTKDLFSAVTMEKVCGVCKVKYIGGLPTTDERITAVRKALGLQEGEFLQQDHAQEARNILGIGMASTETLRQLSNAAYFIEMQRRLEAMEGDSNIVNALQCLCDAVEGLAAEMRESEKSGGGVTGVW